MAGFPEAFLGGILRGIRSEDQFTTHFLKAHKEADGYLYHLRYGPYFPQEDKKELDDEEGMFGKGGDTPVGSSDEEISGMKTPPSTPEETQLDDLPEGGLKVESRNEFVYMPEYRNLFQWRQLRKDQMPKLLQVNKKYSLKQLRPIRTSFVPVEKQYANELRNAISAFTDVCFYYNRNLLENTPKCWIGDGRFTGFGNHLYFFQPTSSDQFVLRKLDLTRLNELCDNIMKLKNALNDARSNQRNKSIEDLLDFTLQRFREEPEYVRRYRWKMKEKYKWWKRNRNKRYNDQRMPPRDGRKRQRRRFLITLPLKF